MTNIDGASIQPSKYIDGPNDCEYFTAGIDIACTDIFGKPDWHFHAIEFHDKDKSVAERRRDIVLAALKEWKF